jgi:tRNA threonylcarbamoyladenosine biosynthesis protein TsaB
MSTQLPIILSIETSSERASAALLVGQHLTQHHTDGVTSHSHAILPMVQALLSDAGLCLADCDAIAYGEGPGSFTGVRTACGVVQGMAYGADLPVIPVITLLAMAEACRRATGATHIVTALDARMGEVYWAHYRYNVSEAGTGGWHTESAPALCAPAELALALALLPDVQLAGNGFLAYPTQFCLSSAVFAAVYPGVPEAGAVAWLAESDLKAGRTIPAEQAQPLYLRNKIAMTTAERQHMTAQKLDQKTAQKTENTQL